MSATVDDRIVSLEFDNKQFEKGVSESLTTLEKLKQSLKMEDAAKNLSAISDAGRKVDLSTVVDSVDQLSNRFSTLRMVGLMALSNIVDGVMGMAKKVGSALMAPFSQIKSGGWARAMNIEDAKFQLEGLGVTWNKISEDINYGVADTAYGLDAAAKAASQLVASGVKFGETYGETGNSPMSKALRGISGVAAMTNSSYEDISSIFTTVAGQGKLMTMQLRQLESRGLNAAATLGKQLGKSEAEIRDMVTKGQVDFETFSKAMDDAFGKHATDANNTFTGALSNIKSALSRVGEGFATPFIHSAIPVLNAVRNMINAIKGNMGEVYRIFERVVNVIGGAFTSKINSVTNFLKNDFTGLNNLNKALYITMSSIVRIVKTVGEAFKAVFNGSAGDHVNNMAVGMEKLAIALQPSEAGLKGLKTALTAIFTVIKKVGEAIGWLASHIAGPLLNGIIRAIDLIFSLIGRFGNLISVVADVAKHFNSFDDIVATLSKHGIELGDKAETIRVIFEKVKSAVQTAGNVISSVLKVVGIALAGIVATPIYLLYTAFQKLASMDWTRFISAITNAKNLVVEFIEQVKQLPIVQSIIQGVTNAFYGLVGGITYLGNAVYTAFTKLANGELTLEDIKEKFRSLPELFRTIGQKLQNNFLVTTVFPRIQKMFGSMGNTIGDWVTNIKVKLEGLTPAKVMLVAFSVAITSLAITTNKVSKSVVGLVDNMSEAISTLTGYFTKSKTPLDKFKEAILTVTVAIGALALSLKLLSTIESSDLRNVAITLAALVGGMTLLMVVVGIVGKVAKLSEDMKLFVQNMALFSLGILSLSAALYVIGKADVRGIQANFQYLTGIVAEMAVLAVIVGVFGPSGVNDLVGLIGFAIAIVAVAHALQKLNGVDLSGIKDSWKEIGVILLGVAALASALGVLGVAVFAGAIAFIVGAKLFIDHMDEFSRLAESSGSKISKPVAKFKAAVQEVFKNIDEISKTVAESYEKLSGEGKAGAVVAAIGIVAAMAAIVVAVVAIGRGVVQIGKSGKYIKRAAVAFAIVAAAIAGLIYLSKYMSQWIEESPNMYASLAIIGGLIVVIGAFMALSGIADPNSLKAVKKVIVAFAAVMLALTAFAAIMGDMDESQWTRANKSMQAALVTIGIFVVLAAAIGTLSKSTKAGFGHFAGITLLFGATLGALATLMIVLKDPEDYKRMLAAVAAIVILLTALGTMFYAVSRIRVGTSWKPIAALVAGAIVIGIAIAKLAESLPDEGYIGKIIAVSASMVLVLGALVALGAAITHFAKDKRFSITQTSTKTLKMAFAGIGELILGILVVAASLAMLKDANPLQLLETAGVLVLVLTTLAALFAGIKFMSDKIPGNPSKTIKQLAGLTAIFAAVAGVMILISKFGGDAKTMLKNSQVIMLALAELVALVAIITVIGKMTSGGIGGTAVMVQLVALVGIFTLLSVVMMAMSIIGADAKSMLKNSQVIMLALVELVAISAMINAIGMMSAGGIGGMAVLAQLAALVLIFAALSAVMAAMELVGANAKTMLKNSQVIMLVLVELVAILAIINVIGMMSAGGIGGNTVLLQLAGLVAIFGVLSVIAVVLNSLDLEGLLKKTQIMILVMTELVVLLTVMALITKIPGISGGDLAAAAASLLILSAALIPLSAALLLLQGVQFEQLKGGLLGIAAGLGILLAAGAIAGVVSSGLTTLSVAIVALGAACLAAGAGVLLFAKGIESLASTTPAQLQMLISVVIGFFTAIGNGIANGISAISRAIASGIQTITNAVVSGIKQLKSAAVNEARGFIPDMLNALFSNSGSVDARAKAAGKSAGDSYVSGFRNSKLGWHSPPEIIVQFFKDTANAITNEGRKPAEAMKLAADKAGNSFSTELSSYLGKINLGGLGETLGSILGGGVVSGASGPLAALSNAFANLLGGNVKRTQAELVQMYRTGQMSATEFNNSMAELNNTSNTGIGITDSLTDALGDLTGGLDGIGGAAGGAASQMNNFQSSLQQTLESQMNIFDKFEEKSAMSKEELLSNMQSQINGMSNWAANMDKLSTMGIDKGLYQKLAEMGPQGAQYVGAFANMTAEEMARANDLWAQSLVLPGNVAAQISSSWSGISGDMVNGLSAGWTDSEGIFHENVLKTSQDVQNEFKADNGIHSPSTVYQEFGYNMMRGLRKGIIDNRNLITTAIHQIANLAISQARQDLAPSNFQPIGTGVTTGLAQGVSSGKEQLKGIAREVGAGISAGIKEGIDSRKGEIFAALEEISKKSEETMKKALKEHSPSRVFRDIGAYVSEGFAIGINDRSDMAVESVNTLADRTLNTMKYTVADIAAQINGAFEDPVITPVLDLSKVQAGVRTLSSTFSTNQALSAASALDALQNGQYVGQGNVIFNQNNYSPKALSRIEIYRDTRNLFAQAKGALS